MSVRRNECIKRPATVKKTGKNEDGERAIDVGGQPSSQSAATGSVPEMAEVEEIGPIDRSLKHANRLHEDSCFRTMIWYKWDLLDNYSDIWVGSTLWSLPFFVIATQAMLMRCWYC